VSKRLGLELLKEGASQLISELSIGKVVLGREPPDGTGAIRLHSAAVSRSHGEIRAIHQHWFYTDLGSTNGSWLNGEQVFKDSLRLLRPRDTLQLADVVLRVVDRGGEMPHRSVLVFKNDELLEEMLIPQAGQVLSIGGPAAQFEIAQGNPQEPALVVEVRGNSVVAYQDDLSVTALCNGASLGAELKLEDRSIVEIGEYRVMYQSPPLETDGGTKVLTSWDSSSTKHDTGGLKATASGVFGKSEPVTPPPSSSSSTVAMKPAEISEYMAGMAAQKRVSRPKRPPSSMSSREKALIAFIVVTLSLALILLLSLVL